MAYSWRKGADWGGGYQNTIAVHPTTAGYVFAGGDLWGIYTSQDGGKSYQGAMQGWSINVGGVTGHPQRASAASIKTPGKWYVGTGKQTSGAAASEFGTCLNGVYTKSSANYGFSQNQPGSPNGVRPRASGDMIAVDYDGSSVEYVYALMTTGATGSSVVARTTSGNENTFVVLDTPTVSLNTWKTLLCFQSSGGSFKDTLLAVTYRNVSTDGGTPSGSVVYKYAAGSASIRTATGVAGLTKSTIGAAPGVVEDLYQDHSTGDIYAACGPYGVYKVTTNGTTWTPIGGTFFNSSWVSSVSAVNGVVWACCANTGGKTAGANTVAVATTNKGASSGDWSWVTTATLTHGSTGQCSSVPWGTTSEWWLLASGAPTFNNRLGGSSFDGQCIRVDPTDTTGATAYICGSAGAWKTTTTGSVWRPSVRGTNGGEVTLIIPSSGGTADSNNTDYKLCHSTDHFTTATRGSTPPTGTQNGALNPQTDASGAVYSIATTAGNPTVSRKPSGGSATVISNAFFRSTLCSASDFKVSGDGYVYVAMDGGGIMVGDPTGQNDGGTTGGGGGGGGFSDPVGDSFTRTASSSLGTADTGQAWVIDQGSTSQFSVDGSQAVITGIAGNAPIAHVSTTQEANPYVQFKYKFSSAAAGATQSIACAGRFTDAQNYDRLVITQTTAGHTTVEMDTQVANVNTVIAGPTTITSQTAGTWYWARFEITPTATWNGYVWPDGGSQPGTPTITAAAVSDTNTTGYCGFRLQCLAGNTNLASYDIDQFTAGSMGSGGGGGGGGTGGHSGPGGGSGGWTQLYESRRELGGAAKTNYGAGMQGRSLYHRSMASAGTGLALQAPTWGYGKFASITLALSASVGDSQPPTTPTGLSASAASQTQINLSWSPSSDNVGVAGYTVYRAGSQIATTGAAQTSFQNSGLTASTTYTYTVDAFDAAGNRSAQSSSASATTLSAPDTQPPSVPQGVTGTPSGSGIALSWAASTDNVGVAGYRVSRSGTVIAASVTQTTYTDTTGTPGTTYSYTVSAFDAAGNRSSESAPVSVTFPQAVSGPQVVGFSLATATGTSITASPAAGTQAGDVIYAQIRFDKDIGPSQITPTAGWALARGSTFTTVLAAADFLLADVQSLGPWTWNWPVSANAEIILVTVRGGALAGGVNASGNPANGGSEFPAASITLADGGDLVLFMGAAPGNVHGGSRPSGFTAIEPFAAVIPFLDFAVFSSYAPNQPSGTNTYTSTFTATTGWLLTLAAFKSSAPPVNTGPAVSVTSPITSQTVNASTVNVQVTATDADGISSVVVSVNGGSPITLTPVSVDGLGNGSYSATVTLVTDVAPGAANVLVVTATDANAIPASTSAGPVTVNAVTPLVDTTAPTLVWANPPSGTDQTVQGTAPWPYTISLNATDPSGLGQFTLDTPAASGIPITPDASGNFSFFTSLNGATSAYTLHTADAVGNTASVAFTVTLATPDVTDTTGPTLVLTSPVGDTTIAGAAGTNYQVTGSAVDASGIASLTIDGTTVTVDSDGNFSSPVTLAMGANTLTVVATDASIGANTTTKTATITLVATSGPTLTITTPSTSTATVQGDAPFLYQIEGTVTQSGTNGISQLTVNSVPISFATDGSWAEVIALSDGANLVTISATDAALTPQSTTVTLTIILSPSAPGSDSTFNLSSDQARMAERLGERGVV